MSERATQLARAVVSGWSGKDAVPSIAETIDVAITVRDEEWRAWLERLKLRFGHARFPVPWTRFEIDDPPPDKR